MTDARRTLAAQLAALGELTRLALLAQLLSGPATVGTLAARVGVPVVLTSHHLRVLRHAGILADVKRGRFVEYGFAPGVQAGGVLTLAGGWRVTLVSRKPPRKRS